MTFRPSFVCPKNCIRTRAISAGAAVGVAKMDAQPRSRRAARPLLIADDKLPSQLVGGAEAVTKACDMVRNLKARGDNEAADTWLQIIVEIEVLQRGSATHDGRTGDGGVGGAPTKSPLSDPPRSTEISKKPKIQRIRRPDHGG